MSGEEVTWEFLSYDRLSAEQVYEVLALRQMVFVVEQHCPYLDADGRDLHSWHLLGIDRQKTLLAYLRLVLPGYRFQEPSIGRVVVHPRARGRGLGRALMLEGIRRSGDVFPGRPIRISAQQYLQRFYEDLGFVREKAGDPYSEDGIPHIEMLYVP
jgi:ElaA protein